MHRHRCPTIVILLNVASALGIADTLPASVPLSGRTPEAAPQVIRPRPQRMGIDELARRWPADAERAERDLAALAADRTSALVDVRGGSWATLLLSTPLLPGTGDRNPLTWPDGRRPGRDEVAEAAWVAFRGWLTAHESSLRIDLDELPQSRDGARIVVHDGGALVQIVLPRVVAGVPVHDSRLTATISHGNLILLGMDGWGRIDAPAPSLDAAAAFAALAGSLGAAGAPDRTAAPERVFVSMAAEPTDGDSAFGHGYRHRPAWRLRAALHGDPRDTREAWIDAANGELLWLDGAPGGVFVETVEPLFGSADTEPPNRPPGDSRPDRAPTVPTAGPSPVRRAVVGGVFPRSNDLVAPDGVEQAGWPIPFAHVVTGDGTVVTDSGGNLPNCTAGSISTDLTGPYAAINDECGAIAEASSSATLDLGTSAATDCSVPADHSSGDTRAARSAFFTIQRVNEAAQARLAGNAWLDTPFAATVNVLASCNALPTPSGASFYRSGGGCRNTGENPSIVQALWAFALDDNDITGTLASPSWAFAYTLPALLSARSCIGRGLVSSNCTGSGDACLNCTGVVDLDWEAHVSGTPHTVTWADAACGASSSGPCGGSPQCEAKPVGEAIWDLAMRDLTAPPFSYPAATALDLATRLHFLAGGVVGNWFDCAPPAAGCGASGGYLNFLAADDDNGNLADGTPHMSAIHAAFERHQLHCNVPTVQNTGCSGGPTTAPVVSATPRARAAILHWAPVAGAESYRILRADGVSACDDGKVPVGETTATSFVSHALREGRTYSYAVVPIGAAPSCVGPASGCVSVVPVDDPRDDDCSLIFADDFESGVSAAWSTTAP